MSDHVTKARRSYVVTGAAQSIGKQIALRLANDGFVVVIDPLEKPTWENANVLYISGDAGDADVCLKAANEAEARAPLVGWVNNAAVFRDAQLDTASANDILDLINLNLRLAITGTHTAVKHLLGNKRPGSIVNLSSHQAQRPVRGALPYSTAKAAIEGFTKAAAVDHGFKGIRVNAIALGTIDNERYQQLRNLQIETDDQMASFHPLGRIGTPNEVAEVVAFLISSQSSFITGSIIPVDGGRAAQGLDPESL